VLCFALNGEAAKSIDDIPIGVIAKTSHQMELSQGIVSAKPYPLRPFPGAGLNMVKGGYYLVAEKLIIFSKHGQPPSEPLIRRLLKKNLHPSRLFR
jgi:hypothetical protein